MSYAHRSSADGAWLLGLGAGALLVLGLGFALHGGGRARTEELALASAALHAEPRELEDLPSISTPAELRAFVRALEAAGPQDAPRLRRIALVAADPLVAGNALRALGRLDLVAADPELLRMLDDPRPRLRQEVVRALACSADPGARARLDELARSAEDPELRALARHAADAAR
jgi:HEAT repeat protein